MTTEKPTTESLCEEWSTRMESVIRGRRDAPMGLVMAASMAGGALAARARELEAERNEDRARLAEAEAVIHGVWLAFGEEARAVVYDRLGGSATPADAVALLIAEGGKHPAFGPTGKAVSLPRLHAADIAEAVERAEERAKWLTYSSEPQQKCAALDAALATAIAEGMEP